MNIGIKDVLYRIRFFFIPFLIVLGACLTIKLTFSREEIYFAVNSHNYPWADAIAPYITDIGNGWTTVALAAILLLFNYGKGLFLAIAYAVTSITAQIVKHIFDAPRPTLYFQAQMSHIHIVSGVYMLKLHSFPSGHTVTAFSTTLLITYWCKDKRWGLPLLILAMLVGYSRMYLSEHFFEDVAAGAALGAIVTVFLIVWLDNQKFIHSEKWNKGLLDLKKK
jgi:membrane-associated phospholipid phosphatase